MNVRIAAAFERESILVVGKQGKPKVASMHQDKAAVYRVQRALKTARF